MDALTSILDQQDVRRLRQLLEERSDAILLLTDPTGRALWGSLAGSRTIFGREPEEYVGSRAFHYLHPDDVPCVQAAMRDVAHSDESREVTFRATDADGDWVSVRTVMWSVTSPGRGPVLVTLTVPLR